MRNDMCIFSIMHIGIPLMDSSFLSTAHHYEQSLCVGKFVSTHSTRYVIDEQDAVFKSTPTHLSAVFINVLYVLQTSLGTDSLDPYALKLLNKVRNIPFKSTLMSLRLQSIYSDMNSLPRLLLCFTEATCGWQAHNCIPAWLSMMAVESLFCLPTCCIPLFDQQPDRSRFDKLNINTDNCTKSQACIQKISFGKRSNNKARSL